MPAPTAYSESVFADYLTSVLGPVADVLGWDAATVQVSEAVNDALLELGSSMGASFTSIASVTSTSNIRGLRALGRRAIWRAVVQATAGNYDFSDSDAKFSRSQVNSQAREMLKLTEMDALEWSPTYAAQLVRVDHPQDPYTVRPDSERVP